MADRMYTDARLVIEEQFGDFDRRPPTPESPEIVTVARARKALSAAPR